MILSKYNPKYKVLSEKDKTCELFGSFPEPKENTIYVVSARVAQALKETNPERTDVMIPAKTLRDSEGNIIGCTGLSLV